MLEKCDICKAEIEEGEGFEEGKAILCEDCYMEKTKRRC